MLFEIVLCRKKENVKQRGQVIMIKAILDPQFQPMAKVVADYQKNVQAVGGVPMVIAVERNKGYIATYNMNIYKDGTGHDEENYDVAERIVKTLLWLYGGYKVTVAGSKKIYEGLAAAYTQGGAREFDANFMARVYEKPFEVLYVEQAEDAPNRGEVLPVTIVPSLNSMAVAGAPVDSARNSAARMQRRSSGAHSA